MTSPMVRPCRRAEVLAGRLCPAAAPGALLCVGPAAGVPDQRIESISLRRCFRVRQVAHVDAVPVGAGMVRRTGTCWVSWLMVVRLSACRSSASNQ